MLFETGMNAKTSFISFLITGRIMVDHTLIIIPSHNLRLVTSAQYVWIVVVPENWLIIHKRNWPDQ